MEAFKIDLEVISETITIPELNRYIGKKMEVIFLEKETLSKANKLKNLIGRIDIDEESVQRLRDKSIL